MNNVSQKVVDIVEKLFSEPERNPALQTLNRFQNERLQLAVLKLSDSGKMMNLDYWADFALKIDYRDVLVKADFATDLEAHNQWADEILNKRDTE